MWRSLKLLITFSLFINLSCSHLGNTQRHLASANYLGKVDGSENVAPPIREMLDDEQNLHVKGLWFKNAFASDIAPEYVPEANPKFPIAYYLIPEEEANFLSAASLDPRVLKQISHQGDDGKIFYKMFVHPESEKHYAFLKNYYEYVPQEKSELMASPTSSYRSLVLWNKDNREEKPFIAKVSLDRNVIGNIDRLVSYNEVERSIANQNVFDQIGDESLKEMDSKIFPETAGLTILKKHSDAPKKLGGQLIREIPDEVWTGHKRWVAWATLISPERGPPMILKVIEASGLSTRDFVDKYMIDGYMSMFEKLSFQEGINFEPHSQNLGFELNPDDSPTNNWVHKDFGGVWPDIVTMAKNKGPVEEYMGHGNAQRFKLLGGRSNAIGSFVNFYKRQVFDFTIRELKKHRKDLSHSDINYLNNKINKSFLSLINRYYNLGLSKTPDMKNYKQIQALVEKFTLMPKNIEKVEITDTNIISNYTQYKKNNGEWVTLNDKQSGASKYFLTDHGVYQLKRNKVVGFSLFNDQEKRNFELYRMDFMKVLNGTNLNSNCSQNILKILDS